MRYAIFSDIHSNLEAYQAFLEDAIKESIDRYFCVGDIVGYGANPRECIELTKSLACPVVCGNHDWAVCSKITTDYFNYNAQKAVSWTQKIVTDDDKGYLKGLPLIYKDSELMLVHGSLYYPQQFGYILDTIEARVTINIQERPLCFIGHSHVAGIFYEDEENHIRYTAGPEITVEDKRRYLVNAGSIGQPRDGNWRSSYCIYDTDKKKLLIKRLEYDVSMAQKKILIAGLPNSLATRLGQGR